MDDYCIGDVACLSRKVSEEDIMAFAQITGDTNPVHIDNEYAAQSFFGQKVAHGMLGSSLISAVLGTELPGNGTIYLSQTLEFKKPIYVDDTITAKVEIVELLEKNRCRLHTCVINQNDELITDGEAVVILPD